MLSGEIEINKTGSAVDFLKNKYPSMKEHWNEHPHINDNWVAQMMEEYAATLSKGEGKEDAAAKEKCWEENGFGIGQPEGVSAEEMKLNILIDAGQGHLFSLHERKIIFEAMEQYALSLIEQKSIFIEKLKQDIYDFYNEKHEFEKQLKEKEAEIEFLNRNSDELMENLAKYKGI